MCKFSVYTEYEPLTCTYWLIVLLTVPLSLTYPSIRLCVCFSSPLSILLSQNKPSLQHLNHYWTDISFIPHGLWAAFRVVCLQQLSGDYASWNTRGRKMRGQVALIHLMKWDPVWSLRRMSDRCKKRFLCDVIWPLTFSFTEEVLNDKGGKCLMRHWPVHVYSGYFYLLWI